MTLSRDRLTEQIIEDQEEGYANGFWLLALRPWNRTRRHS
jgi:hypothetical protein